jgi:hypothetical protein
MAQIGLYLSLFALLLFVALASEPASAVEPEGEAPLLERVKRQGPWRREDRGRWEGERSRLRGLIALERDAIRLAELERELLLLEGYGNYYGWGR